MKYEPQPSVLEAYQQGGLLGALSTIFNAPDPGVGPLAVVQGLPSTARKAAAFGLPQYFKMLRKAEKSLKEATTGKKFTAPAFRAGEEALPERGMFFSADPGEARRYSSSRKAKPKGYGFKAENPLVIDGGQEEALTLLQQNASPKELKRIEKTLKGVSKVGGEPKFLHLDRTIAKIASERGHDAVLFRKQGSPSEFMSLTVPKRGTSR